MGHQKLSHIQYQNCTLGLRASQGHFYSSGPILKVQEEPCCCMLNGIAQQTGNNKLGIASQLTLSTQNKMSKTLKAVNQHQYHTFSTTPAKKLALNFTRILYQRDNVALKRLSVLLHCPDSGFIRATLPSTMSQMSAC